jgi:hypothetical protein
VTWLAITDLGRQALAVGPADRERARKALETQLLMIKELSDDPDLPLDLRRDLENTLTPGQGGQSGRARTPGGAVLLEPALRKPAVSAESIGAEKRTSGLLRGSLGSGPGLISKYQKYANGFNAIM